MKRLIARLLGFDKMIAELEERIRRLGFDESFGALTRPALLERADSIPRECTVGIIFLDFDLIHSLNDQLGYQRVNQLIKATFENAQLRKSDLIGRWFSGDELVILTTPDGINKLAKRLIAAAQSNELSFTWASCQWNPASQRFHDQVEDLTQKVLDLKKIRDQGMMATARA